MQATGPLNDQGTPGGSGALPDVSRVRRLVRSEKVLYGLCGCRPVESFAPGIRDADVARFMERATRERCPKCAREAGDQVRTPVTAAARAADWPED